MCRVDDENNVCEYTKYNERRIKQNIKKFPRTFKFMNIYENYFVWFLHICICMCVMERQNLIFIFKENFFIHWSSISTKTKKNAEQNEDNNGEFKGIY